MRVTHHVVIGVAVHLLVVVSVVYSIMIRFCDSRIEREVIRLRGRYVRRAEQWRTSSVLFSIFQRVFNQCSVLQSSHQLNLYAYTYRSHLWICVCWSVCVWASVCVWVCVGERGWEREIEIEKGRESVLDVQCNAVRTRSVALIATITGAHPAIASASNWRNNERG